MSLLKEGPKIIQGMLEKGTGWGTHVVSQIPRFQDRRLWEQEAFYVQKARNRWKERGQRAVNQGGLNRRRVLRHCTHPPEGFGQWW